MPAPCSKPLASPCPSPSGRSATRQRSSGRPRRRGQRSDSSGGPGLEPCTTVLLRTRMVSAGLGTGTGALWLCAGWAWLCGALCKEGETPKTSSAPCCCEPCCCHPGLCQGLMGTLGVPWLFPALTRLG